MTSFAHEKTQTVCNNIWFDSDPDAHFCIDPFWSAGEGYKTLLSEHIKSFTHTPLHIIQGQVAQSNQSCLGRIPSSIKPLTMMGILGANGSNALQLTFPNCALLACSFPKVTWGSHSSSISGWRRKVWRIGSPHWLEIIWHGSSTFNTSISTCIFPNVQTFALIR